MFAEDLKQGTQYLLQVEALLEQAGRPSRPSLIHLSVSREGFHSHGCNACVQATGLGRLKPNTLVLGFKNDWRDGDMMNVETYISMIQ